MKDESIIEKVRSLYFAINIVGCFNVRDLVLMEKWLSELEKRGYDVEYDNSGLVIRQLPGIEMSGM